MTNGWIVAVSPVANIGGSSSFLRPFISEAPCPALRDTKSLNLYLVSELTDTFCATINLFLQLTLNYFNHNVKQSKIIFLRYQREISVSVKKKYIYIYQIKKSSNPFSQNSHLYYMTFRFIRLSRAKYTNLELEFGRKYIVVSRSIGLEARLLLDYR